jgi:hypothetical protein
MSLDLLAFPIAFQRTRELATSAFPQAPTLPPEPGEAEGAGRARRRPLALRRRRAA